METVKSWVVSQMDTKPQEGELIDVVSTIHWRRQATAVDGDKTYYADTYGAMGCATPSDTDFTAYPDLTFEQVCGWLEDALDVEALNANLDSQIENQINPPIVAYPLPWVPVVVAPVAEEVAPAEEEIITE
jgi:hypothetical protein